MVSARNFIGSTVWLAAAGVSALAMAGNLADRVLAAEATAQKTPAPGVSASPSPTPTLLQQPLKPPQSILPARMNLDPLETLPIFRDGRVGSYFLFCRQALVLISGSETYQDAIYGDLPAVTVISSVWLNPESWEDQPIIQVNDQDLRRALALRAGGSRESFAELTRRTRLPELMADARATRSETGHKSLELLPRKMLALGQRIELFSKIRDGTALLLVPPAAGGDWVPVRRAAELYPGPLGQSVPELADEMQKTFRAADPVGFATARDAFAETLARLNSAEYPDPSHYKFEVWITKADLGRWAAIVLACGAVVNMLTFQRRRGVGYVIACFLAILGAALLAAEMVGHSRIAHVGLRSAMGGSPYLIPMAIIIAGLLFELCWRRRYILLLTTAGAALWLFISAWLEG